MPMEKEDMYTIVGIIMILVGIALLIWGAYYIYAGSVVSAAEAALAQYGYQGASGAGLIAGGVVLLIIGIILLLAGIYLIYKYKLNA